MNDGKASNTIAGVRYTSFRKGQPAFPRRRNSPGSRGATRQRIVCSTFSGREPDFSIKIKLFFLLADLHVHSDTHRYSSYQLAGLGSPPASETCSSRLVSSRLFAKARELEGKGKQERRASAGGFRMDFARFNGTRHADVNLPALVGFNAPLKQPHLYPPSVERSPPSPLFHPRRPTSPPTYTRLPYLPTYLATLERPPSL